MNPSKAEAAINVGLDADIPVMLWGAPGVGKSEVVFQIGASRKMPVRDVRLSQMDPVDIRGIPSCVDGYTIWNVPHFLPNPDIEPEGIMFFDEINQATHSVQAAAYQLILDRKVGDYELPEGWRIVCAGNRAKDRALANKMSSALNNRLIHVDFEPQLQDWVDWANTNNIRPEIISFMRFRPEMLHEDDHAATDARQFATPRTWSYASRILDNATPDLEYEMLIATVGEAAAGEFMSYIRIYRDLPDIESIEKDPKGTPMPTEPASLYAVAGMLSEHMTEKNIPKVNEYLRRMPDEFQVPTVKMTIQRSTDLLETKEMAEWIADNTDILL